MKTIVVNIEDEVFQDFLRDARFTDFIDGCCAPPPRLERIMIGILKKMVEGKESVEIGFAKEKEATPI